MQHFYGDLDFMEILYEWVFKLLIYWYIQCDQLNNVATWHDKQPNSIGTILWWLVHFIIDFHFIKREKYLTLIEND